MSYASLNIELETLNDVIYLINDVMASLKAPCHVFNSNDNLFQKFIHNLLIIFIRSDSSINRYPGYKARSIGYKG